MWPWVPDSRSAASGMTIGTKRRAASRSSHLSIASAHGSMPATPANTDPREATLAEEIRIEFTRFSAFYSPLIATMAGGFLKAEGLEGKHSVSAPGKSAIASLLDGSVHVAQSAPSQGFTPLEQGKTSPTLHFAQINEKDGFFLTGRSSRPGLHVGQAQRQEGDHRPRRPADGHVQVRLLQARTRFQGYRGGGCRLDRQDDRSLPQRRGRFHPSAGPGAAAARA